jgi:opacity protein-like surface antigen
MRIPKFSLSGLLMALVLSVAVQPSMGQEPTNEPTPDGGRLEKVTDKDGHLVQTREFDQFNNFIRLTLIEPTATGGQIKTVYDGHSNFIEKTVVEPTITGGRIEKTYDKNGHLKYSQTYDKSGAMTLGEKPASWGAIKTDYKAGRPVESRFYDQEGNLLGRRQFQHDQHGQHMSVTSIYYDDGKKVKEHIIWNLDGNHQLTTYDKDGHPIIQKKAEHNLWSELNSKTGRWDPCDEPKDFAAWGESFSDPRATAQSRNDASKDNGQPPANGEPPKTSGKADDGIDPEDLDTIKKNVGPRGEKPEDEPQQDQLKKQEKQEPKKNSDSSQSGRPVPQPTVNNASSQPSTSTTSTIGVPYPKLDLFAGYSYIHHTFGGNQSSSNNQSSSGNGLNFNGGSGAVAFNFTPMFGVVGNFGAYHNRSFSSSPTTFTYLFGPQFTFRGNEHVSPFFHVLLGGAHQSESFSSGSNTSSSSNSSNAFALAGGGGLDVHVSPHIAIRVAQVDYLLTKFQDDQDNRQNNIRISAGIVFRWGATTAGK